MKSFVGIVIIGIGFVLPLLLQRMIPDFLYGVIIAPVFFWVGFLVFFNSFDEKSRLYPSLRWAKWGIVLQILLTFLLFGVYYLYLGSERRILDSRWIQGFRVVVNPVHVLFDSLFPQRFNFFDDKISQLDSSLLRPLFAEFCDLLVYACIGFFGRFAWRGFSALKE